MNIISDILTILFCGILAGWIIILSIFYIKHRPKKEHPEIYKTDLKKTWNENKTN